MCRWGTLKTVPVFLFGDKVIPHWEAIDACIADYVNDMNKKGIITSKCCCAHRKTTLTFSSPTVWLYPDQIDILQLYGYQFEIEYRTYNQDDGSVTTIPFVAHTIPEWGIDHQYDWSFDVSKKEHSTIWVGSSRQEDVHKPVSLDFLMSYSANFLNKEE